MKEIIFFKISSIQQICAILTYPYHKLAQISTNKHERLQELVYKSQEGGARGSRSPQAREDGVSQRQGRREKLCFESQKNTNKHK